MSAPNPRLILGSSSPRRKELLAQIDITPDAIASPDINEDPLKNELPAPYVTRLAIEKNAALADQFKNDFIITADTTLALGRRIIGKAENEAEARKFLTMISGRAHLILTAVAVKAPDGRIASRLSKSRVKVKKLSDDEIDSYLKTGEWEGKAGAYMFQGRFAKYVIGINGSPSGIIGLPLFETMQLLKGFGYAHRA